MENLYTNPWVTIPLTILYACLALNFAGAIFALNADPILIPIETKNPSFTGITIAPFIILKNECLTYTDLRREYQHYMQQSLLTPLGFLGFYIGEYLLEGSFDNVSFEQEAVKKENDSLEFEVFNIKTFKKMKVYSDMGGGIE